MLKRRRWGRGGAPAAHHRRRSGVTADSSRVRFYPDCSGRRTDSAPAKPYPMRRRWVTDVGHTGSVLVRSRPALGFAPPPRPSARIRRLPRGQDRLDRVTLPIAARRHLARAMADRLARGFALIDLPVVRRRPVARGRVTPRRCTPNTQPACVHLRQRIAGTVVPGFRSPQKGPATARPCHNVAPSPQPPRADFSASGVSPSLHDAMVRSQSTPYPMSRHARRSAARQRTHPKG